VPADKLHITLAGREHVVEAGTTAGEAVEAFWPAGAPAADGEVIAARVNGVARDLASPLADGDEVAPIGIRSAPGLAIMRHSTAHVLASRGEAGHRPAGGERLLLRLRRL